MIVLHMTASIRPSCKGCALDPATYPGATDFPRTMTKPAFVCDFGPYPCDSSPNSIVGATTLHERVKVIKAVTPAMINKK